jgi:hypothetical protein
MKRLLLFLLIFSGCAGIPGMPGSVSQHTSKFDGTKEIKMEPAWCDNAFKLGLFKTSNMLDSLMILSAHIKGIVSVKGAAVRIGENIYPLKMLDDMTSVDHEGPWSYRRFMFPETLLAEMISAEEVWVKVKYDDSYTEGRFSRDDPTAARPGFKNFYAKLENF